MSSKVPKAAGEHPGDSIRPCPLCRGTRSTVYMPENARNNRDGVELRRCRCGFVFSKLPPYDYTNYWSTLFEDCSRADLLTMAHKEALDVFAKEILGKVSPKRILDFGAGIGMTSIVFQELGCSIVAVEASERYRVAHRRLGLTSASSIDGKYDLIIAKDVLEHLEDPRQVLSMLTDSLCQGGHIYLRVPNVNAYPFLSSVDTKGHVNHFSPKNLFKLASECGLDVFSFVGVYDISSKAGRMYHAVFWPLRRILPMYHQISVLFVKR